MNRWWWVVLGAGWAAAGAAIWWWYSGGQHWLAIQTGTCPVRGSCNSGPGPHYGYWSGFGSVFPWSLVALGGVWTGVWVIIRKHNCHEPGCWRIGRVHVDDKGTLSCWVHHPDGRPTRGHVARAHAAHQHHLQVLRGHGKGPEG